LRTRRVQRQSILAQLGLWLETVGSATAVPVPADQGSGIGLPQVGKKNARGTDQHLFENGTPLGQVRFSQRGTLLRSHLPGHELEGELVAGCLAAGPAVGGGELPE